MLILGTMPKISPSTRQAAQLKILPCSSKGKPTITAWDEACFCSEMDQCPASLFQQRLLIEQIAATVAGYAQLRENDQIHALGGNQALLQFPDN